MCNSEETDLLATDEADAALMDATLNDELNAKLACAATECALLLACTDALDKLADVLREEPTVPEPETPQALAAGEDEGVGGLRVDLAGDLRSQAQGDLRTVHGADPPPGGCLGEAGGPVEAVVIGQRDRLEPGVDGSVDELFGF